MIKKLINILKYTLIFIIGLSIAFLLYFFIAIQISEPHIDTQLIKKNDLRKINDSCFTYQDSWLRKNRLGLWEMYVSGSPEELGIKNGILSQQLISIQEDAFVAEIKQLIPSDSYLVFLKYILSYMNRKMPEYIPMEYLKEIKAVSLFASNDYDFIGDDYKRLLNYHAAHDIG
ncbi:MAG: peptidase C45, partial [Bacteroidales bacterium]|nr:peptidase C45 [Bacteroidales bacterium]